MSVVDRAFVTRTGNVLITTALKLDLVAASLKGDEHEFMDVLKAGLGSRWGALGLGGRLEVWRHIQRCLRIIQKNARIGESPSVESDGRSGKDHE